MSDMFGNHIVGFPTRRLIYYLKALKLIVMLHAFGNGFMALSVINQYASWSCLLLTVRILQTLCKPLFVCIMVKT